MVRLLKVKELEERKRLLLAKSEMYRQTLTLETANIKFSLALLKRKLKSPKAIMALVGLAALPTAGFLFARKRQKAPPPQERGLLPKLVAGMGLFMRFAPMLQKFRAAAKAKDRPPARQNLTQYP